MAGKRAAPVAVGLVQMSCGEDPRENLDKALSRVERAVQDGARIVCHEFAIEGVEYERRVRITSQGDGVPRDIYLYRLPLRKKSHSTPRGLSP